MRARSTEAELRGADESIELLGDTLRITAQATRELRKSCRVLGPRGLAKLQAPKLDLRKIKEVSSGELWRIKIAEYRVIVRRSSEALIIVRVLHRRDTDRLYDSWKSGSPLPESVPFSEYLADVSKKEKEQQANETDEENRAMSKSTIRKSARASEAIDNGNSQNPSTLVQLDLKPIFDRVQTDFFPWVESLEKSAEEMKSAVEALDGELKTLRESARETRHQLDEKSKQLANARRQLDAQVQQLDEAKLKIEDTAGRLDDCDQRVSDQVQVQDTLEAAQAEQARRQAEQARRQAEQARRQAEQASRQAEQAEALSSQADGLSALESKALDSDQRLGKLDRDGATLRKQLRAHEDQHGGLLLAIQQQRESFDELSERLDAETELHERAVEAIETRVAARAESLAEEIEIARSGLRAEIDKGDAFRRGFQRKMEQLTSRSQEQRKTLDQAEQRVARAEARTMKLAESAKFLRDRVATLEAEAEAENPRILEAEARLAALEERTFGARWSRGKSRAASLWKQVQGKVRRRSAE